jgi:hypothetical protein
MEARIAELTAALSWDVIAVWIAAPGLALFWVEWLKAQRKKAGQPLGTVALVVADSLLALALAIACGSGLFGWPVDKAIRHGIGVALALPLLASVIFRKAAQLAPEFADDMGFDAIPTQYRVDDTTPPKP